MSMALSSLEPPTNLLMLHRLSSTSSSVKMFNDLGSRTDLKVQCLFEPMYNFQATYWFILLVQYVPVQFPCHPYITLLDLDI